MRRTQGKERSMMHTEGRGRETPPVSGSGWKARSGERLGPGGPACWSGGFGLQEEGAKETLSPGNNLMKSAL